MLEIKSATDFETLYRNENQPIVLDFYTSTCNPCKTLEPILKRLDEEYGNELLFLKTRADKNIALAKDFGVTSVPTLIFIDKNKNIERANGLITEHALRTKIKELRG